MTPLSLNWCVLHMTTSLLYWRLECAKAAAAPTMNMISAELCLVFNLVQAVQTVCVVWCSPW